MKFFLSSEVEESELDLKDLAKIAIGGIAIVLIVFSREILLWMGV